MKCLCFWNQFISCFIWSCKMCLHISATGHCSWTHRCSKVKTCYVLNILKLGIFQKWFFLVPGRTVVYIHVHVYGCGICRWKIIYNNFCCSMVAYWERRQLERLRLFCKWMLFRNGIQGEVKVADVLFRVKYLN